MYNSLLITSTFQEELTKAKIVNKKKVPLQDKPRETCKLCGKPISRGYHYKDCISSNFNDFGYFVSKSDYICPECDFCLKDENSLRKINFICNKDFFKKLTKSEALEFIKYPPEPPFYFQVTYSNKKHIFFKGKLNDRKDEFYISTDQGNVLISKKIFFPIYESCLELYNAGFSKNEIASGEFKKFKLIDVFGMEKLLNISNSIDIFRNTQLLQLVLHILQKDGEKEND